MSRPHNAAHELELENSGTSPRPITLKRELNIGVDILAGPFEEARRWGLSRREAVAHFTGPLVALMLGAAIYPADRDLMRWLVAEDGPIETIQVLCFCVGAVFAGLTAWWLGRGGRWFAALLYSVLMLGLVFVVGEELAWGQRILNFTTPPQLAAINSKLEVSIHNIDSLAPMFTMAKLAVGAYGTLGAWMLLGLSRRPWATQLELFVVPAFLSAPFVVVLGLRILRLTVLRHVVPLGYGELEELILAYGIAAFVTFAWWRVHREANASHHA